MKKARAAFDLGLDTVRQCHEKSDKLELDLATALERLDAAREQADRAADLEIQVAKIDRTTFETTEWLHGLLDAERAKVKSLEARLPNLPSPAEEGSSPADIAAPEGSPLATPAAPPPHEASVHPAHALAGITAERDTAVARAEAAERDRDQALAASVQAQDAANEAQSGRDRARAAAGDADRFRARAEKRAADLQNTVATQCTELRDLRLRDAAPRSRISTMESQEVESARLLREARRQRKIAGCVRDALAKKLAASAAILGGSVDLDALTRVAIETMDSDGKAAPTPAPSKRHRDSGATAARPPSKRVVPGGSPTRRTIAEKTSVRPACHR
ncbi:hypothetical protein BBJ28_00026936 [Nothophytophthora sp. Chile5]|nr:hypothetical protein BBJ28_00026936 [Nothophytophthora sp. Chile5]